MKSFFFFFLVIFYASSSYANDEDIKLISTKYSNNKTCESFKSFKVQDNLDHIENFSILKKNYLIISFKNKQNQVCYTMRYYPDMTPFIYFKISDHRVQITEMSGTAASGNWFDKIYKIDKKTQTLRYIETKF